MTCCIILLEATIRRWVQSGRYWHLCAVQPVQRGPKFAKRLSLHITRPPAAALKVNKDRIDSLFSDPAIRMSWQKLSRQTKQCISNLILSNFGEPVWTAASVSWQELHLMWSSAVVAPLLQGLTCCAFTDVCLHMLVVMSSHQSYRHPISL